MPSERKPRPAGRSKIHLPKFDLGEAAREKKDGGADKELPK